MALNFEEIVRAHIAESDRRDTVQISDLPHVGIEIENESHSISRRDVNRYLDIMSTGAPHMSGTWMAPWELAEEGSLRGGAYGWEIRTINQGNGMPYRQAIIALYTLYPLLHNSSGTWRAAIHTHVDANDLTKFRKAIALGLCYAFDAGLFTKHSEARRESNFCEPLSHKSGWVLDSIGSLFSHGVTQGYGRYSSVNSDSLSRWGSFEFRHMQTPATQATYSSVTDALVAIQSFVDDCVTLVAAAQYVKMKMDIAPPAERTQQAMFDAAMWLNEFTSLKGMLDEDALTQAISAIGGKETIDYTRVDLGSIVSVARR